MKAHEPWSEKENLTYLEQRLLEMYGRFTPDPRFLARLEGELEARRRPRVFWRLFRWRWTWTTAVALLAFLVGVAMLGGPRQVWAQVLRLIGYAPRVGFVAVEGTRVLAAPVTFQIGDATVRLDQVVATQEETRVVVFVEAPTIRAGRTSVPTLPPHAALRTPDGTLLRARQSLIEVSEGQVQVVLTFPPLPTSIGEVELDLTAVAQSLGLPQGNWRLPLTLYPADSPVVAGLLVAPYQPDAPPQTHHGITLRVLRVAQTPDETGLQLEAAFPGQYTFLEPAREPEPILYDDAGHVYYRPPLEGSVTFVQKEVVPESSHSSPTTATPRTRTWQDTRAPVSALARQLTYIVPAVEVTVPLETAFSLDLGPNPEPGDVWPLNVRLEVAGALVYVEKATLLHDPVEHVYYLVFVIQAPETDRKRVVQLGLYTPGVAAIHAGGPEGHPWVLFEIHEDNLPTGLLTVQVQDATLQVKGPWRFTWDIPRPALSPSLNPVVLRPKAQATNEGITLSVDALTLTDRVTVFDLKAQVPEGLTMKGVSGRLVDLETGHEWKPQWFVGWCAKGDQGLVLQPAPVYPPSACRDAFPGRLTFGPLPPTVKRLALRVDGVLLFREEPMTLRISLPRHLRFDTQVKGRPAMALSVDEQVGVGPFTLRFTQGWVVGIRPMEVWLLSEPLPRAETGAMFDSMPLAEVRGDGRALPLPSWQGGVHALVWDKENCEVMPEACRDVPLRALLRVPLIGISPDALPSRLEVTLAGVEWWVPGSWNLTVQPERLFWEIKGSADLSHPLAGRQQ